MAINLIKEAREDAPWLFSELSLSIVDEVGSEAFGDAVMTLFGDGLLVRFVRDRGQITSEISPESSPGRWWNLEDVYSALKGENIEPIFEFRRGARILLDIWTELVAALRFDQGNLEAKILQIELKRRQDWLDKLQKE